MNWNYRICKETKRYKLGEEDCTQVVYGIHEAYYNEDGEIFAVTENPKNILSCLEEWDCTTEEECIASIKDQLEKMVLALNKPVLDLDTIVYAKQ